MGFDEHLEDALLAVLMIIDWECQLVVGRHTVFGCSQSPGGGARRLHPPSSLSFWERVVQQQHVRGSSEAPCVGHPLRRVRGVPSLGRGWAFLLVEGRDAILLLPEARPAHAVLRAHGSCIARQGCLDGISCVPHTVALTTNKQHALRCRTR